MQTHDPEISAQRAEEWDQVAMLLLEERVPQRAWTGQGTERVPEAREEDADVRVGADSLLKVLEHVRNPTWVLHVDQSDIEERVRDHAGLAHVSCLSACLRHATT